MSEYIDNQSKRKKKLKELIHRLHEGASVDEVKEEFASLLASVGPDEIANLEQTLIAEGMPEQEIQRLCDVHVAVFRESLEEQPDPESMPGHPIHTMRTENEAIIEVLDRLKAAIEEGEWEEARQRLQDLREFEKHYVRKENVLFPFLERHGFTGPSSVMWAIHDDVREGWKSLEAALSEEPEPDPERVKALMEPMGQALREMTYKEEKILFPNALRLLDAAEWRAVREQSPEVGYAYVEPGDAWPTEEVPAAAEEPPPAEPEPAAPATERISLHTGALTVEQIDLMLQHQPIDITYVDENDEVRFFSETEDRIFQRSPAIIGRKVQNCHPPSSVDKVQQILDDFRAKQRDVAEFWIQMGDRFIHIRYFALREDDGTYRGTIEVTQDITEIRQLEGERRLLDEA